MTSVMVGLACLLAISDNKTDWPAWRGPFATGEADPSCAPPTEWSETKNVTWKQKIPGSGSSTPIVLGNKIFILTAINTQPTAEPAAANSAIETRDRGRTRGGDPGSSDGSESRRKDRPRGDGGPPPKDGKGFPKGGGRGGGGGGMNAPKPSTAHKFVVMCLDRETGKTLWETSVAESVPHEAHHRDHGYASYSPVTDGEHLYVSFGSRGLHCLDLNGKVVWSKELGQMRTRNSFGEGSSPCLADDMVIVLWDHEGEDDYIAAFEKKTGEQKWKKPRAEATSWTTPIAVKHEGKTQIVVPGTNSCISYDLATGETVWEGPGLTTNVIPSAVARGDMIYLMSGFRGAKAYAVKLGAKGKLSESNGIVWKYDADTPYVPSPVLAGDLLGFNKSNDPVWTYIDAKTGKTVGTTGRLAGVRMIYASPVFAGGKIYVTGRDGTTVVLDPKEPSTQAVATNKLDEGVDASLAIAGNQIFIRGKEHLYCISAKN